MKPKPSKYATFRKTSAGPLPVTILVPQFEMQPLVPCLAVPGEPVFVFVQNSSVTPH